MRICFLLHEGRMQSGGQGIYFYYLARELARRGHDVHAIVGPPYPDAPDGVTLHPVDNFSFFRLLEDGRRYFYESPPLAAFHPLNFGELVSSRLGMYSVMGAFSIRAYGLFRGLHAQRPFDVVHDNQVLGYGSLLIRALGVPVVATVHHPLDVDRQNRIRQARDLRKQVESALFYPFFMQGVVARRLDRIISVSGHSANAVARALRLDAESIEVVANGVDVELFRPRPDIERRQRTILAVMNSEDRNKGARVLMAALRRLAEQGRRYEFVLVDQTEERLRLVPSLAREYDLTNVRYTGPLSGEDLVREYASAQLFVSPSLYEGFGLPVAEALACGGAVVATTIGAAPELVEDGVSGALVPPGDADGLAGALAGLLDDAERCRRLGEAARRRIVESFTWEQAASRLDAIYRDVICERSPGQRTRPAS